MIVEGLPCTLKATPLVQPKPGSEAGLTACFAAATSDAISSIVKVAHAVPRASDNSSPTFIRLLSDASTTKFLEEYQSLIRVLELSKDNFWLVALT